jgi:hypothetical protein
MLEADGWQIPDEESFPTGRDLVELYRRRGRPEIFRRSSAGRRRLRVPVSPTALRQVAAGEDAAGDRRDENAERDDDDDEFLSAHADPSARG